MQLRPLRDLREHTAGSKGTARNISHRLISSKARQKLGIIRGTHLIVPRNETCGLVDWLPLVSIWNAAAPRRRGNCSGVRTLRLRGCRGKAKKASSCWSLLLDVDCWPPEEKGIQQAGELLKRVRAGQLFFEQFVPRSHRPYNQPFQPRRKGEPCLDAAAVGGVYVTGAAV